MQWKTRFSAVRTFFRRRKAERLTQLGRNSLELFTAPGPLPGPDGFAVNLPLWSGEEMSNEEMARNDRCLEQQLALPERSGHSSLNCTTQLPDVLLTDCSGATEAHSNSKPEGHACSSEPEVAHENSPQISLARSKLLPSLPTEERGPVELHSNESRPGPVVNYASLSASPPSTALSDNAWPQPIPQAKGKAPLDSGVLHPHFDLPGIIVEEAESSIRAVASQQHANNGLESKYYPLLHRPVDHAVFRGLLSLSQNSSESSTDAASQGFYPRATAYHAHGNPSGFQPQPHDVVMQDILAWDNSRYDTPSPATLDGEYLSTAHTTPLSNLEIPAEDSGPSCEAVAGFPAPMTEVYQRHEERNNADAFLLRGLINTHMRPGLVRAPSLSEVPDPSMLLAPVPPIPILEGTRFPPPREPEVSLPNLAPVPPMPSSPIRGRAGELIGRGGCADVYRIRGTKGIYRAQKVINLRKQDETGVIACAREVQALSILRAEQLRRLERPTRKSNRGTPYGFEHVIQLPLDMTFYIRASALDQELYLNFQYYPENLHQYVGKIQKNASALYFVISEITQGLSYLHSLGIVHLDIKPENIFLTNNRHCVIGDFGGSVYRPGRILPGQEGVPSACRTYTTPGFCAPELSASYFHFHLDVMFDCRADFWSLGVTIFNMVVPDGIYLPEVHHDDWLGTARRDTNRTEMGLVPMIMRKRMIEVGCPTGVTDLVVNMCQEDPEHRLTGKEIVRILRKDDWLYQISDPSPLLLVAPESYDVEDRPPSLTMKTYMNADVALRRLHSTLKDCGYSLFISHRRNKP